MFLMTTTRKTLTIGDTVTIDLDKLWGEGGIVTGYISGFDASGYLYATFDQSATWYRRERDGMALADFQMSAVTVTGSREMVPVKSSKLAALGFECAELAP